MSSQIRSQSCDALITILKEIEKETSKYVSIYVAIGSAANPILQKSGIWTIQPNLEQQFPPFLQKLKEELPFEPLHIILIDPLLENPPFVVSNQKRTNLGTDWSESKKYIHLGIQSYHNQLSNITIYALREAVKYSPNDGSNSNASTDTDQFIKLLNTMSIRKKWFTVVNDFTGKNMQITALYYDKFLGANINHIVYGTGGRSTVGCYVDLTLPESNFVYNTSNPNGGITIFNAFNKPNNTDKELISTLSYMKSLPEIGEKTKRDHEIAMSQIASYIKFKRRFLMVDLMCYIRQVGIVQRGTQLVGVNLQNYYIENNYFDGLVGLYEEQNYSKIMNILLNILKMELKEHLSVLYKENTELIIDHTISEMLSHPNPYQWYNFVKKIIDDFDEKTGTQINLSD